VSRQRRPAAVTGSAEVVSIGAGGTHRPNYFRLACGQVAAARRNLGLSREGFARHIYEETGWDVLPETITAWEDDVRPPGDVVLACMAAAQGLAATDTPLLDDVPPAFPVEALAGPWVSTYRFSHAGRPQHHADIAHVTALPGNRVRIVNHPPEPRSEGRRRSFRNEIHAALYGRHLIGQWRNVSDTRYYGTVQLAVLPGEIVMEGCYAGVASDIEVSSGDWKWVRLDPGDAELAAVTLRGPAQLYEIVMEHTQFDAPLTLAEIREDT
jgi:hypothetical protein